MSDNSEFEKEETTLQSQNAVGGNFERINPEVMAPEDENPDGINSEGQNPAAAQPRKKFRNPLARLYDEENLPPELRRSLTFILIGNICGALTGYVCFSSSSALVTLAASLGAKDLHYGIISSFGYIATVLAIPYSMLVNRTHKRKKYMLTFGLISRALWLLMGFIPLVVPASPEFLRIWTLIFIIGASSCLGAMIQVAWFPWFGDLAPESIQSRFFSFRDVISSVVGILYGLFIAWLLDTLPEKNRYLIVFLVGSIPGIVDMICFAFVKEVYASEPARLHLFKLIKEEILKNRNFLVFVLMYTLWIFGSQLGNVYFVPYAMNVMGITHMQNMIFGTCAASLATLLMAPRWGRAIHLFGAKNVLYLAGFIGALTPLFYWFAVPKSVVPVFLYHFTGTFFFCGVNICMTTMQISNTPAATRATYLALLSVVSSVIGATLGSLAGGAFLDITEERHIFEAGFVDRYKVLFTIGTLIRLAVIFFLVPKLKTDSKKTVKDLAKWLNPFKSFR